MKTLCGFLSILVIATTLLGCRMFPIPLGKQFIKPSNNIITETRDVSGFTSIDMGAFGKVVITQGDSESLTIKGSDNIVPLIETTVTNGVLLIKSNENVDITGLNSDNVLTFTITVKDLTNLTLSGAGDVSMDALSTSDLAVVMSGAGQIQLGNLTAESLNVNISGAGNVEIAGEVTTAKIDISGAGSFKAPDLKVQTANITISGMGGAEVWVTDTLTGNISGAGGVKYYGSPTVNTTTSGVGRFESMGSK